MKEKEAAPENPRVIKSSEYLRYDFTEKEFLELAKDLGRLNQELARAEERKKSVSAQLASEVKLCEEKVSRQSSLVTQGYEYRDIDCEIQYHIPKQGMKRTVRKDTGEVVREVLMSGQDLQDAFDFTQDAEGK